MNEDPVKGFLMALAFFVVLWVVGMFVGVIMHLLHFPYLEK